MLTLEQVKKHSLDLYPKYIFKIPYIYTFKAVSLSDFRISFFNETKILHKKYSEEGGIISEPKEFVLPYMIEISHETYSHLKRYSNISTESPILSPIKGKKKLLCPNNYKAESGFILEYFFADDYDEINYLKYRNINLYPLTDSKYWTDINFNKMKKFNREQMIKLSFINNNNNNNFQNDFENLAFFDKGNYDDDNIMRCVFRKFN